MADERIGARPALGQAYALLAVAAYATVNALLRLVAGEVDPFLGSLVRQLPLLLISATALLVLRPHVLRRSAPTFLGTRWILVLLASGMVSFVLGNVALFGALDLGGLVVASAGAQAGMALGGALLSLLVLREPPSRPQLAGVAVVLVGLGVFAAPAFEGATDAAWGVGVLLAILAGVCYTVANTAARGVQRRPGTFLAALGLTNIGGAVLLGIIVAIRFGGDPQRILDELGQGRVVILLAAGAVNAVALASVTLAVRYTTVTVVSTTQSLVLVAGVLIGWLAFGEPVGPTTFIGAAIILVGVLISHLRIGKPHRPAPVETASASEK